MENTLLKKELQESVRGEVSQPEQLPVMPLFDPHEKPFTDMGESLLGCILKTLIHPPKSLFKIYSSFDTNKVFWTI